MTLQEYFTNNAKLQKEWLADKNTLKPEELTPGSPREAWWQCDRGHQWQATIGSRTGRGDGCPFCSGHRVWPGFNDLTTTHPHLAAQWHPELNGDLTPQMVSKGSTKCVWWVCEKGHQWQQTVLARYQGVNCPGCSEHSRTVLPGINDLSTTHPEIAAQWNYNKNGTLSPRHVKCGSNIRAWWICEKGHEWQTQIRLRVLHGCPYCAGKRVLPGFNDLQTKAPEIVSLWHPTQNGELTPSSVCHKSGKKVWWLCPKGHSWQALVREMSSLNQGCPYCSGHRALAGETDLATTHPHLAAQWHPELNGELTPQMVTFGSGRRVWWLCEKGHTWSTQIVTRTHAKKQGCPVCAGRHLPKQPEQQQSEV